MMRAMFAAIAGLRNHITYMDVVGNNIANVNTTAFKSSRVTFQDAMSQSIAGASAPTAERGGTNPVQIGLGMNVGGIDVIQTQGSLQSTGKSTDFAVEGGGFFILRDGAREFYTRDGAFDSSASGELVSPTNGFKVQGWRADANGAVDTTRPIESLGIPYGQATAAQATTAVTLAGNLDAGLATGAQIYTTVDIKDSLGASHLVTARFTKNVAPNTWDIATTSTDPNVTSAVPVPAQIVFDGAGAVSAPVPPAGIVVTTTLAAASGAASPVVTDFAVSGVTQFASPGQMTPTFNNGFAAGSLVTFSVGPGGDITGIFSNGSSRLLGQMAVALFTNTGGLARAGSNNFESTSNSGIPIIGTPGTGGRGTLAAGVLEGSNTDLAREFTNVVMAQRGFQASSKIITTADEILNDLVNLKR